MTLDHGSANALAATTKWLHMRADQHLGEATKPIKGIEKILETGFGLVSIASRVPARSDRSTIHGVGRLPSFFLVDR
jgi:hypothetical protein